MAKNDSGGGTPVQIAYFNNHRLIIDTDKCDTILEKVGDHPLSVVSINGPMRNGKSYVLGHFLKYLSVCANRDKEWFTTKLSNEFHWLNSTERQTTGIYMWSEPFFIERDGRKVGVLLMDTQGFFDDKSTTQENSLIFALSCLLSSVLIYNVSKLLSEDIFQFLQMFIGYAKMTEGSQQSQSFTKLIFLIRDWQFPKEFEFGYHDEVTSPGQKNFKKEKLNVNGSIIDEVRIVRQEILSNFKNIGCCLMPYPGDNLALDDNVENLNPRFIETLKDFVPRIFDAANIVTKIIGGQEINGNNLKKFIKEWAHEFIKIELPEVKSIAESTAAVQNQIAGTIALKFYNEKMDKATKDEGGLSDEEFEKVHQENMEEAFNLFERMKRLENEEIKHRYFESLKESIYKEFERYKENNRNARRFLEMKIEAEERQKELKIEMEENDKKAREYQEALKQEMEEIAKKSLENEKELKRNMEEISKKAQEALDAIKLEMNIEAEVKESKLKIKMEENAKKSQEEKAALKQEIEEIAQKSLENEEALMRKMKEVIEESREAQEALKLELKNKAEAEEKKLKIGLLNKIKRRLVEKKNEVKECISNYLEEVETMINKTNSVKSYAEAISIQDFSDFSWFFTKTILTGGIALVVTNADLKSKMNNLTKEIELFETKQKYREKEFLTRSNEAFSIVDELMECSENFGEDCTSNIPNSIFMGCSLQLVMIDVGPHIRLFRERSNARVAMAMSLSKEFIVELDTEKRHCEFILEKLNIGLLNKIKRRLAERMNDIKECISNYLVEIESMINKTNAIKSYAEGISVQNFSDFSWFLTKTVLTLGIAPVVEHVDLKSKLNNLIKEMELFETKQKYRAKEFLARINQAFSIVDVLMECSENFGENCTLNISNSISMGRSVQLVMIDMGSHIRLLRESWNIPKVVSLSIQFIAALDTEKRYCESILANVNQWNT